MSAKANAIKTLYKAGRITIAAVRLACEGGIITADEYEKITGMQYK